MSRDSTLDARSRDVLSPEPGPPVARADGAGTPVPSRFASPIVAERKTGLMRVDIGELVQYRDLLFYLTWRDIKVRYKQTALGIAWAVLQPLLTMVVFMIFFNRVAGISSGDIPYALFSLGGIVLWTFFANSLSNASQSLVASATMLTKVYFPRIALPIAVSFGGAVDFGLSLALLVVFMAALAFAPTAAAAIAVPISLLIVLFASLGVGLLLSALNVRYRDVRFVVPFIVQLWLLASPIGYSAASLAKSWLTVYGLVNPIAGAVETFRWGLLGAPAPPPSMVVASAASAAIFFVVGLVVFGRMERSFADVV